MATIQVKDDSVNIHGLQLEMQPVLVLSKMVWDKYGYRHVVTSARDGLHSVGSLHYYGYAVDLRTWTHAGAQWPYEVREEIADELRKELRKVSKYYDVIAEKDHIHVEYDILRKMHND